VFPFWNAGVRLSFFLIVTFTLASLRDARSRQADLANFIVHDLRSPLSNIVTGMKYLLEYSEEDLQPEQRDVIEIGLASSVWMMSLVNSLLDLAKLESGQLKPHLQPTDVAAMFDSALENISAMAMNNDVEIVTQIDADAERALADSELVVRILVNLVSNALKYSPQKATVTIRAFASDSDKVALSVTDQGAGIPKKWVKNVFNKFAQVEARGTGIAVGSGLGLTFCKMAVEAHGGRIWLESELGQGTTIYFTLPKAT
jgi:signal transduction histidine kinase